MSDQGWSAPGSQGPVEPAPPGHSATPPPGYSPAPPPGYPAAPPPAHPPRPGQWAPPRLDFRPGIIPLRPLRMDDIFGGVFRAVRGNLAATIGLATLTSMAFLIPFTAIGAWVSSLEPSISMEDSINSGGTAGLIGSLGQLFPSVGSSLSNILLAGFLAYVIGQAVLGRKVTMAETWNGTKGRIWGLLGATALTTLIFFGAMAAIFAIPVTLLVAASNGGDGLLGLGIAGIFLGLLIALVVLLFLWTRLAFVTPSVVLDGQGVRRAFARSWRLTGGDVFWRLLGIRLLAGIIIRIAASFITMPLALIGGGLVLTGLPMDQIYIWQAVVTGLTGIIAGALTTPFTAGIDALLFVDHRIRREGLDVQLIQTTQGTAAPPWPRAEA